jgi:hypothetical protein
MTRLRSSTFALRATADKSSFGEARSARSQVRFGIVRACLAVAAQLRRRAFTTAAIVMIGGSSSVLACPVCFGAEETSMIDGAKLGVLVMLAITLAVQGGFVGFFLYLRKRAKRIADLDLDTEWSELQRPSRTS